MEYLGNGLGRRAGIQVLHCFEVDSKVIEEAMLGTGEVEKYASYGAVDSDCEQEGHRSNNIYDGDYR